ncbi:MAG: DUF4347 domain-containing protein [Alphaproteobacteria bacterium]|nr:DUF4347 domain-containing protein [Alphaproteobacteria bacterium]
MPSKPKAPKLIMRALEQRFMMDAAGVAVVAETMVETVVQPTAAHDQATDSQHPSGNEDANHDILAHHYVETSHNSMEQSSSETVHLFKDFIPPVTGSGLDQHHEIIIIDSGVEGYEQLVQNARPDQEVFILDSHSDGVSQITSILNSLHDVDSVHIISHGNAGELVLGSTVLSNENLAEFQQMISSWSGALTEDADILIYGCDVAQGETGHQLVDKLADLTGADIAASENITGAHRLGGDWVLEQHTGTIEAHLAYDYSVLEAFDTTLVYDPVTVAGANSALHLDATDLNADGNYTNNPTNGSNVSNWVDRSSMANHFTQTTSSQKPTYSTTAFGGIGGVNFSGSDHMDTASFSLSAASADRTFAFVIQTGNTVAGLQVIYQSSSSSDGYVFCIQNGHLYAYAYESNTNNYSIDLGAISTGTTYALTAVQDSTAGTWSAYLNGELKGSISGITTMPDLSGADSADLGAMQGTGRDPITFATFTGGATTGNTGINYFTGKIGEVFITNGMAFNTAQLDTFHDYLVDKWGASTAALISDIPNQTINEDNSLSNVPFTLRDFDGNESTLTITTSSSNTSLIPNGNITVGGSGINRTLSLTPAANANGTSTITVTVSDGVNTRSDTFVVTVNAVNDAPTLSTIANQTTNEDTALNNVAFTISDVETASTSLVLTATSSDQTLIPNGNITFGGSGANRTINFVPAANASGVATITLNVSDGTTTTTQTFTVTVNAVNDAPTLSTIANQTTNEDTALNNVAFTISDVETASTSLVLTATSSNTALIPNGNITFGGSGANRTINFVPAANASGVYDYPQCQ